MKITNCVVCDKPIDTSWPKGKKVYCDECKKLIAYFNTKCSYKRIAESVNKRCLDCGKQFSYASLRRNSQRCHICDMKRRIGDKCPSWRGGIKRMHGYIWVYHPEPHPHRKGKYVAQHVLNWEKYNKKPLPKGFTVHHLNGIKNDNRGQNLVALLHKQHSSGLLNKVLQNRVRELEEKLSQQKLFN